MRFSVVVPIYNVAGHISNGLKCLMAQTFTDFEVILVDDGSSDGSADICERAALEYGSSVRVIHQANAGSGPARNSGIDAATGDYIWFFDIDDYVKPDCLSCIDAQLRKADNPQLLIFGYNEINPTLGTSWLKSFAPAVYHCNSELRSEWVETLSGISGNNGFVWNKVYERQFLKANNIRFEPLRIQQDEVFNLSLYPIVQRTAVTDEILYDYYVYNSGNTRSRYIPDRFDIYSRVHRAFLQLIEDWQISDTRFLEYVQRRFIRDTIYCINYNIHHPDNSLSTNEKHRQMRELFNNHDVQSALPYLAQKGYRHAIMQQSVWQYELCRNITMAHAALKDSVKNIIRKVLNRHA